MRMGIVTFQVGSRAFKFKEPLMLEREESDELCLSHKELCLTELTVFGVSVGEFRTLKPNICVVELDLKGNVILPLKHFWRVL